MFKSAALHSHALQWLLPGTEFGGHHGASAETRHFTALW